MGSTGDWNQHAWAFRGINLRFNMHFHGLRLEYKKQAFKFPKNLVNIAKVLP